MIKMSAKGKDGQTTIVLGLSHNNLHKLKEDGLNGFIKVDGADIGAPGIIILITAGETEDKIAERFAEFIGPDTKVKDRR